MILEGIAEAQEAGARLERCCEVVGLNVRTIQRWRGSGDGGGEDGRRGPLTKPGNALTPAERTEILAVLTSQEFAGDSPNQIVPKLADMGIYRCSEVTMYRILREERMLAHREAAKPRSNRRPDEHRATGPNQVWAWDITYLRSPITGKYFYLYVILDVWSRYIVGWRVEESENSELAAELLHQTCRRLGLDPAGLVLHSDNGSPMRGSTMLATMQRLGVVASFSRPSVSDDNAYAEALFRTCKYRPGYPRDAFESVDAARAWVADFVGWYNDEHQHSGIRYVTPSDRHHGRETAILAHRKRVYAEAKARRPDRWTGATRNWTPISTVTLNPSTYRTINTSEARKRQAA